MQSETKALIWLDLDNDGDDDLFVQEETGRCGLIRNDGEDGFCGCDRQLQLTSRKYRSRWGVLVTWTTTETWTCTSVVILNTP